MGDKKPRPTVLTRLIATLTSRRATNIAASILLPLLIALALSFLPPVPVIDTEWDIMWKTPIALMAGFIFVLREFKEWALLLCWAYFLVMYWVVRFVDLFISMKLYGTYY